NCNDRVDILAPTAQIFLSIFAPSAATAKNAANIKRLACWAEKQFNLTSLMLTDLLMDGNSIRHALLQNRAAIDFLLLAQGHGCEDFEGMCCMNLSDHSESIHSRLKQLQDNLSHLTIDSDPFSEWLKTV
ncbi:hypothetical protein N333_00029, partial [Nestor notabilis]